MTFKPSVKVKENPRRIDAIPATVKDKDVPSVTGPVAKQRADFKVEQFFRQIKQHGYALKWQKAMICPCRSPETDQPRINCTFCDGIGFTYIDPIDIQAIMTGFSSKQTFFKEPGHWLEGVVNVTVEPQYRLNFFDSLEMQDSIAVFNEWIVKGNRRGIRAGLADGVDRTRYPIVRVVTAAIIQNNALVRLEEKAHFKVTKDGLLEWTAAGNALVDDGTTVSIHYEYRPVLLVVSSLNLIRTTITQFKSEEPTVRDLPLQVMAQIEYMARDRGSSTDKKPVTNA